MMMRIARTQMKAITVKLLKEQNGLCLLCESAIDLSIPKEGVLDHDHATGEVRGVLHRWCNGQLGKVENAAIRAKKTLTYDRWLANAVKHIQNNRVGLMYPSHKTDDEKRVERNLKEQKRRAAAKVREAMKARQGALDAAK